MFFQQIRDDQLAQYAYLIGCPETGEALVIDPERDVGRYIEIAEREGLDLVAAAETHIHADFLSGARELAEHHGAHVYLSGEGGEDVEYEWTRRGDYEVTRLGEGDTFEVGNITFEVMHTPGHTPEHLSFLVTDGEAGEPMGITTGDFVFVGSLGRPDLLESSLGKEDTMRPAAKKLYASAERFLELDDYVQVWPGHGAGSSCGEAIGAVPQSTVGYETRQNKALQAAQEGEVIFVDNILGALPEPPRYFSRMKKLNQEGPPLLGDIPEPRRLAAAQLEHMAGQQSVAVVDVRSHEDFMEGHLPASILAPLGKQFAEVAGSYVTPNMPVYLIVPEERVQEAVLGLVRIGIDNVTGYATPDVLERYGEDNRLLAIDEIDFDALETQRQEEDTVVVDVRSAAEYEDGHVPDAVHLPHTTLLDHRSEIAMDQTLLVHCSAGRRSAVAAAFMERYGYNVRWVNDRFENWAENNPRAVVTE